LKLGELPSVAATSFTERSGINAVASIVNDARCIWRETPLRDVGIDGQVEYVTPAGAATGRLVLVQVKSGASYFESATAESVPFSPKPKHRGYWEGAPLPVILVLFNPADGEMISTDARHQLRIRREEAVMVPRQQRFDADGVLMALASAGPLPLGPDSPGAILEALLANVSPNPQFPLSFFDLFVNGMTDACLSLYFGMDLVTEMCESVLAARESDFGWSLGEAEYAFLDEYVRFVVANDLARISYDWYREMVDQHGMVAKLYGPLTYRGRLLVRHIVGLDATPESQRSPYQQVIQEWFVQMLFLPYDAPVRTEWIESFKKNMGLSTS
jgi:hypothetical protein